jgi:hypothetical protein
MADIGIGKKSNKTLCLWQEAFYEKFNVLGLFKNVQMQGAQKTESRGV